MVEDGPMMLDPRERFRLSSLNHRRKLENRLLRDRLLPELLPVVEPGDERIASSESPADDDATGWPDSSSVASLRLRGEAGRGIVSLLCWRDRLLPGEACVDDDGGKYSPETSRSLSRELRSVSVGRRPNSPLSGVVRPDGPSSPSSPRLLTPSADVARCSMLTDDDRGLSGRRVLTSSELGLELDVEMSACGGVRGTLDVDATGLYAGAIGGASLAGPG